MTGWVGGRTSVTSVVGLLPMALQGLDITAFLEGARLMDAHTRKEDTSGNAAMLMALMWHFAGDGVGKKDMVILPYKDRLTLMAKYLQQLIMESLGKEHDLDGKVVEQGIAVYGNKGSTDQHAYVQQLRDGVNNFFATFIEVRESFTDGLREPSRAGDYLQGFLRGTRRALTDKKRPSMTLSLSNVDARSVGAFIALFERAVGYYAALVNINAYHQPGVEAGKVAAEAFIAFLQQTRAYLQAAPGKAFTADEILPHLKPTDSGETATAEEVYHSLIHMAHNDPGVSLTEGKTPQEDTFTYQA
jgi:glucose-6-phosphate isomerase